MAEIRKFLLLLSVMVSFPLHSVADLFPVCDEKGKWGYEDENGNLILKYKYNAASEFSDGVAMVKDGNKYGIINESGKYILKPKYDMISNFNAFGLADVIDGNKHGFINRECVLVIPCKYRYVGSFNSDGIVWVNEGGVIKKGQNEVSGGKFAILRKDGSNLLSGEYASIGYFTPWKSTYSNEKLEKMTITERRLTEGENYSFWRKTRLNFVPESTIPSGLNSFYASKYNDGSYNGVFDSEGRMIVRPGQYYFANCPEEGISVVHPNKNKRNFLNVYTGQHILPYDIDESWGFKNGYCIGAESGLYYIYGKDGQKKSAGYTYIYPSNNGVHVVRNGEDKYGMISEAGKELIKVENYSVYPCIEGLSLVRKTSSSAVCYVNNLGKEVIPPLYRSGYNFNGGYAMVSKMDSWGMIDNEGTEILPFEFNNLKLKGDADNRLFWCLRENGGLWECYDIISKTTVIQAGYSEVYPFDATHSGMALVKKINDDNSWGWIDKGGNVLVPCKFDKDLALKAANEYLNNGKHKWDEYTEYLFRLHNMKILVPVTEKADESLWDY